VDTSAPLGVVDPESNIQGTIESLDGEPCDVMLALVDPSKNSDKFVVLQLIRMTNGDDFVVYTRWGRTGTAGQALEQGFDDLEAAFTCFEEKFKQKTGLKWKDRAEPAKAKKYRFVAQNFTHKRCADAYLGDNIIMSPSPKPKGSKKKGEKMKKSLVDHTYSDYSQMEISDLVEDYKGVNEEWFPAKLHRMLSTPDYAHIIAWKPHGRAWAVLEKKLFIDVVLPRYFNHGNFESFNRSVNGWGFKVCSRSVFAVLH